VKVVLSTVTPVISSKAVENSIFRGVTSSEDVRKASAMKAIFVIFLSGSALPSSLSFGLQFQRNFQSTIQLHGVSDSVVPGSDLPVKRRSLLTKKTIASLNETSHRQSKETVAVDNSKSNDYDGMTVIRLKEILRERGLQISGLKDELKKRLSNNDIEAHRGTDSDVVDNLSDGEFSSSERDFLNNLVPQEEKSSSAWVKSSSETAYNDRKYKDQQMQEEQKEIVRYEACCNYLIGFLRIFDFIAVDFILRSYFFNLV
jgi:SAP domain